MLTFGYSSQSLKNWLSAGEEKPGFSKKPGFSSFTFASDLD